MGVAVQSHWFSVGSIVTWGEASVSVVEHNMVDVIKMVDWIIDISPGGDEFGGKIIAEGIPEKIVKNPKSVIVKFLKAGIVLALY